MRPVSVSTTNAAEMQKVSVAGNEYTIIVSGSQANGAYAVIDMVVPPKGGPGPHAHKDIQETFFVLEGEVVVRSETQVYTAKKGSSILIEKGGAVHGFKNESNEQAHLICTVMPAGLDEFFKEIGKPLQEDASQPSQEPTEEEKARLKKIAEKYGQELFPPNYFDK